VLLVFQKDGFNIMSIKNITKLKKSNSLRKKRGRLTLQIDEMWSDVKNKRQKVWIRIVLDVETREIVAVMIGDRSEKTAQKLWESVPKVYRECAVCYTDFGSAYQQVLPKTRQKSVSKSSGKTRYIETFNKTLRQRCSRLVRKTLSFSKKWENHWGEIWYFIHEYNSLLKRSW
jgi:insertion element IS1 protein InsB